MFPRRDVILGFTFSNVRGVALLRGVSKKYGENNRVSHAMWLGRWQGSLFHPGRSDLASDLGCRAHYDDTLKISQSAFDIPTRQKTKSIAGGSCGTGRQNEPK